MKLTAKLSKKTSVGGGADHESWGMGFFLVFFPQDFNHSSSFKSATIKRTNSIDILSKAQSTISICALLIFLTLLLFTLSTFEPKNNISYHHNHHHFKKPKSLLFSNSSSAFQKLGTLYLRGTNPMNDLLICHVTDSVTVTELKTFLRAFHRSGLLAKSDLLFIFPSDTTPDSFDDLIREENRLFLKLIHRHKVELGNGSRVFSDFPASFDVTQFVKSGKKEPGKGDPIWGQKKKSNGYGGGNDLARTSHGSVVGFGVGELDPENSLSGLLDHVPMSLRRWASYPMILGRLRRNFKHVMLVDVKEVLLLGDPLVRGRNRVPESVLLTPSPPTKPKHNRKIPDRKTINPAVIMGGARGIRRLSAAMLTEIVRATTDKKKIPLTESELLSRLATNEFVQKSIRLVVSAESIPEASSLTGVLIANHTVVRRGNSNIDIEVLKHICSFSIDSWVYRECQKVQKPF